VTVMVPNSLGPGELLMHYGTKEQQKIRGCPRLVDGTDIPCFGLTGPEVGSDATAMPDIGVVGYGEHQGKKTTRHSPELREALHHSSRRSRPAWASRSSSRIRTGCSADKRKSTTDHLCAGAVESSGVEIGRRIIPALRYHNGPIFGRDVFSDRLDH